MHYNEIIGTDLFSFSEEYYLAHCISADFAMGRGIAVEFNRRFNMKNILTDKYYPEYLNYFISNNIKGDCILKNRVLNLITKERYYEKPTYESMRLALIRMLECCQEHNISKVAMPTIGCGLDKLEWAKVHNMIVDIFKNTDMEIVVCRL